MGPALTKKLKSQITTKTECSNCKTNPPNLIEAISEGDIICADCGTVIKERVIDMSSEWRTFSNELGNEDPSRVGGPSNPFLDSDQLDTVISTTDGYGSNLSRVQARSSLRSTERTILSAFNNITAICERANMPQSIINRAKHIYKIIEDKKALKGKSIYSGVAACIYAACRQEKVPRTFKEISALACVSLKDIGKCYKSISPFLDNYGGLVSIEDFMSCFCSRLNVGMQVMKVASSIVRSACELDVVSGKNPISIAAASIYMATHLFPNKKRAQREISTVCGVSDVTIKNTYKDLYPFRMMLIPPDIVDPSLVEGLPSN